MVSTTEKPPNTRKYEVGTGFDYSRVFRDFDGTAYELDAGPSPNELRKMIKTDAQARQLATAVKVPIRKAKWDILPGEGDSGEKKFIEWALHAPARQGGMTTPIRKVIAKMANALIYRFTAFEKVWKVSDRGPYTNKVVLHKLGWRPTNTVNLRLDDNGSFNGFVQEAYKGNNFKKVIYDPRRSFVYINGDDESVLGTTSFDSVYYNWKMKQKVSFFYFAFLENVAFPRTIVTVANEDPDALEYLINKAKKLASQGVLGLYEEEDIQPYESMRSSRDYQSAMDYLDGQMSKALLYQFMELGTGEGDRGSYALSEHKMSFFYEALESVLDDIADAINNYLIADLIAYNYGISASMPQLKFRPLTDSGATQILDMFKNIIMANSPNVTPPFLLSLMTRVEEILDLEVDPMAEYDKEKLQLIIQTIPTAREQLESRENRAGAGQNPVAGADRNNNRVNDPPQDRQSATSDVRTGDTQARSST